MNDTPTFSEAIRVLHDAVMGYVLKHWRWYFAFMSLAVLLTSIIEHTGALFLGFFLGVGTGLFCTIGAIEEAEGDDE